MAILALLLAEGLLRLYFAVLPAPSDSRYIPDPDCDYRLRSGPFWEDGRAPEDIVNSFGFRDHEHEILKPPNTFRVLGIGDSFVLGPFSLDQGFLRVAGQALTDSALTPPMKAEVILMGLGGYGPQNELGVLRSTGLGLQPDLVVLCFYVGNDVTALSLGAEVLAGELYFTRSSNRWHNLLRKSRLFVLAEKALVTRWRIHNLRDQDRKLESADLEAGGAQADREPGDAQADRASPRPNLYYLLIQKKRLPVFQKELSSSIQRQWEKVEEILIEFDRLCTDASIPWLLLLIPTEEQIDPLVRTAVLEALSLSGDDYDFDLPQRRLNRFARSHGIATLDLLPSFRSMQEEGSSLYIPNDTHWNEPGNRLAGELIARHIRQRFLSGDAANAGADSADP
jgi:hypothetical protein